MRASARVFVPRSETQESHGAFANNAQLPARETQLNTEGHATATPLWGPTRYDLHLNVERGRGRLGQTELDRGGMKRTGWAACFPPVLYFDRLRLLLGSVSLLSHGQGRRRDESLGKGVRGLEEQWGGWSGGEGWNWLRDINIFDSQMITLWHS